jgi:chemotaxis protein CheY-P-specific phosphatase CheC
MSVTVKLYIMTDEVTDDDLNALNVGGGILSQLNSDGVDDDVYRKLEEIPNVTVGENTEPFADALLEMTHGTVEITDNVIEVIRSLRDDLGDASEENNTTNTVEFIEEHHGEKMFVISH